ncbi:hypothetical protein AAFF_G00308410 [Aldrovandia affinis]|uniref:Uncharacterized protein n=1 Tax=Aldrovandia affinis TaxID=143900 RepID=A0AAD7SP07_9TELE|nr:hypothetical protein AAFF_G00308410 [Aldrovandia affinis]
MSITPPLRREMCETSPSGTGGGSQPNYPSLQTPSRQGNHMWPPAAHQRPPDSPSMGPESTRSSSPAMLQSWPSQSPLTAPGSDRSDSIRHLHTAMLSKSEVQATPFTKDEIIHYPDAVGMEM